MTEQPTEFIPVRLAKVAEIDAMATGMDRSRDSIVNQAVEQYLENNAWQIDRIKQGVTEGREGRTVLADDVFSRIAGKHDWPR